MFYGETEHTYYPKNPPSLSGTVEIYAVSKLAENMKYYAMLS